MFQHLFKTTEKDLKQLCEKHYHANIYHGYIHTHTARF